MKIQRQKFLIAAAVAALMAGSGIALAQQQSQGGTSQGGAAQQRQGGPVQQRQGGGAMQKGATTGQRSANEQRGANVRGAQGEQRSAQGTERRSTNAQRNQDRPKTTGQNTRENQPGTSRQVTGQERRETSTTTRRGQSERAGLRERSTTTGQSRTTTEAGGTRAGGEANLSAQQRTRIHDVIVSRRDIPRVSSPGFAVRVGTVIPRSERLVVIPSEIVRIYPRWRGYRMFLVGDEIVIVDPATFRIVAVLPA